MSDTIPAHSKHCRRAMANSFRSEGMVSSDRSVAASGQERAHDEEAEQHPQQRCCRLKGLDPDSVWAITPPCGHVTAVSEIVAWHSTQGIIAITETSTDTNTTKRCVRRACPSHNGESGNACATGVENVPRFPRVSEESLVGEVIQALCWESTYDSRRDSFVEDSDRSHPFSGRPIASAA